MTTRGHTLVEAVIVTGLLSVVGLMSTSLLVSGTDAYKGLLADQDADRIAGELLDAIAREIKDAQGSTVVFSAAQPDTITFRRMIGYDPTGRTDAEKRILSAPITLRRVPFTTEGGVALYAVERAEGGGTTTRIAAYVDAQDLDAPTAPGLTFAVTSFTGYPLITASATVSVGAGRTGRTRLKRSVHIGLEVP